MASGTGSPMREGEPTDDVRRRRGPPPWVHGGLPWSRRSGRPRFGRRVALFLGVAFLLLFLPSLLAVAVTTAALGDASHGTRLAVGIAGSLLFAFGVFGLIRSVRRTAAPIGDVMEAADRVADGDYTVRVSPRGPRDVRRLGTAFNEMTERLEASDDLRRRLLADVVHELRTPLSVVQGNLEAIVDGVYELDREHVTTVLEETRVMARLLDDLQTLSTAEAGALRLEREPTDVAALADDVVAAFDTRADALGLALSAEAGEGVSTIEVDPVRIRQVLDNLVGNALRHTPRGGSVTVRLEADGKDVVVAVEDTGVGIAPAELASIFDRYARSSDSRGSGLGLAIAKSLVEAHGGDIEAASEEGRGTTIRFRLPASA
jgi:signal transduction histidine kinase